MKIAIMQPYFVPYIGYFQLIDQVDKFVVYDNIEYTKKGWINRNRILMNASDELITLPVKKDSDFLPINQRFLADSFKSDSEKILRKIGAVYMKAPYFDPTFPIVTRILEYQQHNLFEFIFHSIHELCGYIGIQTELVISSTLDVDHTLRSQEKVIAICKKLTADTYVNPIGGLDLYSRKSFLNSGIDLQFMQPNHLEYTQLGTNFVPWLSILDVLMFNSPQYVKKWIQSEYTIVRN